MVKCSFLAKTGAEFREIGDQAGSSAWMACHFSLKDGGLSNLPERLSAGSVLILNDQIPICGHDHRRIRDQLAQAAERFSCAAVLLDLERPRCPETAALVEALDASLPCPLAVAGCYAEHANGPVFLPALPPDLSLTDHLAPWQGRELWLEAALSGEALTLTAQGVTRVPLSAFEVPEGPGLSEPNLHCHYTVALAADSARFTLWRTPDDLSALLEEAAALGVTTTVGLYQELGKYA